MLTVGENRLNTAMIMHMHIRMDRSDEKSHKSNHAPPRLTNRNC